MECDFCKKTFSTKYLLTQHQKKTKYCLDIQGEQSMFECNFCRKHLSTKDRLIVHTNSCKEKTRHEYTEKELLIKKEFDERLKLAENIIQEKNDYISKLEAKLEKIEAKLETKLEKLESTVTTIALEANRNNIVDEESEDDLDNNIPISPIPLSEQMSSIVIEEVKEEIVYSNITLNNVVITSRPLDHYVNATQLCQAGGKKFNDWFRLDTTKDLINELSSDAGIPVSLLVDTIRGRSSKFTQGSWIHPDLSIQLAQWISPKFAIQVSKWIRTLFNQGSLQIDMNLLHEKDREMRIKDHRIKQLETVCLSKQRRVEYPERNVIYMLTTEDHRQRRTYIIGKAKNLTNRLSTYNKTCDHTVVHYRECKNEHDMDAAETMVLTKLRSHREQANRDRFILPEDKDESFFSQTIDECVQFLE
jgi:KilA-N domain/Meiotically up-regulated gene 113